MAARAQESDKERRDRAMAMYEQSGTLYKQKKYADAAVLLREAYALEPAPVLQYNLARCLERTGDQEGALTAYEIYLRDSEEAAPHRAAVDARVAMLRRTVAQKRGAEDAKKREAAVPVGPDLDNELPPTVGTTATPTAVSDASDHEIPGVVEPGAPGYGDKDDEGVTFMDIMPWAVAGVGVAVAAVGMVLGMSATSKADDANDPDTSMMDAAKLHDDAESLAGTATILLIAGGVVAVGGLTWGVINLVGSEDEPGDHSSASLRLLPTGVMLSGRF